MNNFTLCYRPSYYLTRPHELVTEQYRNIKWVIQRGLRGYADCDVWGLDTYVSRLMVAGLNQLAKNKIGHPVGMTRKGWDARLKRMAGTFKLSLDIMDMKFKTPKESMQMQRKFKAGMKLFVEHYFSLWD